MQEKMVAHQEETMKNFFKRMRKARMPKFVGSQNQRLEAGSAYPKIEWSKIKQPVKQLDQSVLKQDRSILNHITRLNIGGEGACLRNDWQIKHESVYNACRHILYV